MGDAFKDGQKAGGQNRPIPKQTEFKGSKTEYNQFVAGHNQATGKR